MNNLKKIEIRMYGTGTGDCFILKFIPDKGDTFNMMVDGGAWNHDKEFLRKAVEDLKNYVENRVDVLVITHEHLDHVNLFEVAEDLFTDQDFKIEEIWMAWTEDEKDELAEEWKEHFGQKKKALAMASGRVRTIMDDSAFKRSLRSNFNNKELFHAFDAFSSSLEDFENLHYSRVNGVYKGGLKGMEVIKKLYTPNGIRYFEPGDIVTKTQLSGVKFYMLGPPRLIQSIRKEKGRKEGETYDHNKVLRRSNSFSAAVVSDDSQRSLNAPFEFEYIDRNGPSSKYIKRDSAWRKIDQDWLMAGAGSLALRLNTGLNNLSLVFAIEIEATKDVLLFTGDAEIGNWESWHKIDWGENEAGGKHFTEDLLSRTAFYKVAHHLSHNGTAKDKGLKLMKSKKLVSMASLDYNAISSRWKSTMPNRGILKDLISQSRGRLIVMNDDDLFLDFDERHPLPDKIDDAKGKLNASEKKEFKENFSKQEYSKQYCMNANS